VEITNNRIKDCHVGIRINEATGEETGVVYLHDNILEDNNGTEYGAIFVGDGRIAKIVNNIIQNNNATGGSGGITVDEGGRIQNADDAFWLANLLPGTAQTAAEVEGVVQTNTFSGNSVNLNTSADGKDVFYTRSTAPTAENIEAHASLDTVTVTADYTVGDIVRVYTAADATTEVASATYSGPPTGSRGVDTVTVNYDVQADTNYYVSVQGDIYKYAESTRTEKLSIERRLQSDENPNTLLECSGKGKFLQRLFWNVKRQSRQGHLRDHRNNVHHRRSERRDDLLLAH
jgi:hypothetical protein